MKAICLIADVVKSREVKDRGALQRTLKSELARINGISQQQLFSPYTITLGDEFQAVYRNFSSVFVDILRILWAVQPIQIRFSISYDELTTDLNEDSALGMDGPAFYVARDRLNAFKTVDRTIIGIAIKDQEVGELANDSLAIFSRDLSKWSRTTLGCFMCLVLGLSVKETEEYVKVKERMIYKSIAGNNLRLYAKYLSTLTNLLDRGIG